MIKFIEYGFVGLFALTLAAQFPVREREISDAFANAQIGAAKESEAATILKEAETFKQAGKFQAGAEKLREVLPLSPDLSTPTIIRASQALDSLLVTWQISSETNRLGTAHSDGYSEIYTAWQEECSATERAIYNLNRQIAGAKQELSDFERKQQQHRAMGEYNTRMQMQKKIVELETQRVGMETKLEELRRSKPNRPVASKSTPVTSSSKSRSSPWKYYEKLQTDFREAMRDAKLRDSKRR